MLENPDGSMDRWIDRWINKPRGWKRVYSHSPILLSPLPDMHVGVMYTKDPGKGGREDSWMRTHIKQDYLSARRASP